MKLSLGGGVRSYLRPEGVEGAKDSFSLVRLVSRLGEERNVLGWKVFKVTHSLGCLNNSSSHREKKDDFPRDVNQPHRNASWRVLETCRRKYLNSIRGGGPKICQIWFNPARTSLSPSGLTVMLGDIWYILMVHMVHVVNMEK